MNAPRQEAPRFVRLTSPFAAVMGTVLGGVAIIGWHLNLPQLIQIHGSLVPMQYNTALCFLLSGLGLGALVLGRTRISLALGILTAVIGTLTLSQYLLTVDFGIDELLFKHYIFTQTSHPGRMSPLTAIVFSLAGLATLVISSRIFVRSGAMICGILGSLIVALGTMALFGYLTGLIGLHSWGSFTKMALHTASGAMVLGLGLMATAWRTHFSATGIPPAWLSFAAGIAAFTATIIIWNSLVTREKAEMRRIVSANAEIVRNEIISRLDSHIHALQRMAKRWESSQTLRRDEWQDDAHAYIEDFPGYQGSFYADPETLVTWVAPPGRNSSVLGKRLNSEESPAAAFENALRSGKPKFTRPITLPDGSTGLLLPIPMYHGKDFKGFMVGAFAIKPLLHSILPPNIAPGYAIAINEGKEPIYRREGNEQNPAGRYGSPLPIEIHGARWTLQVEPDPGLLADLRSPFPLAVLALGTLFSGLLALCIHLARRSSIRARQLYHASADLESTHAKLVSASHRAGMAEVATSVLHNVGNVLNSVNTSCAVVGEKLKASKVVSLSKTAALLQAQGDRLTEFFREDPRGMALPGFLEKLAGRLEDERDQALAELGLLAENINHIKDIIDMQQTHAMVSGIEETIPMEDLVEDSIRINGSSLSRHHLEVARDFADTPPLTVERHKVLQILVNLISNAKDACEHSTSEQKRIIVRTRAEDGFVVTEIADNGVGIPEENLTRIFSHGFTTKQDGHGFGLHSSALAAKQIGGSLTAESSGVGKGAVFSLRLPLAKQQDGVPDP